MTTVPGPSSFVPIRNIWLLQVYASKLYQDGLIRNTEIEDPGVDLPHLATALLCDAVQRSLRKGLARDFVDASDDISRVRGRIDLLSTKRRSLLQKGRVACTFNELSVDTPENRLLRHALDSATRLVERAHHTATTTEQSSLIQRCRHLSRTLVDIGVHPRDIPAVIPPAVGRRTLAHHAAALAAARLVLDMALPDDSAPGTHHLQRPVYSEESLRKLFEKALVGIFRHHLHPEGWTIKGAERLYWNATGQTELLPSMKTDISMYTPEGNKIIADAKFTGITSLHNKKEILKSENLYQLHAYLTQSPTVPGKPPTAGVLIYASMGADLHATMLIGGHPFRCATVDLTADGPTIRKQAIAAVTQL
ncbi:5-methylcytosine restriction system specificity protein McrC [Corynebacterium marinum]|uniref:5-methylcytosine-specific restriction enzyme subunit McrC n=1 Tax=Corynebacterium marinum DSM 44953 TaxID=1224162 RepID=A0A0B6THT4_9CORY|nr:hypothetical protein [Corynebacterium marinum]AJK69517.1 hypothetical protein B840_09630 [Corynebacterium marinum DSM 44953]